MAYISRALRREVAIRARDLCEYCQAQQIIVVSMQIDHIIPVVAGGTSESENLCLACMRCNGFKLDFQFGVDPATGQEAPLFHPRMQRWSDHFRWSDDRSRMIGKTATGRATISRLRLNRADIVASRLAWSEMGKHPPIQDS